MLMTVPSFLQILWKSHLLTCFMTVIILNSRQAVYFSPRMCSAIALLWILCCGVIALFIAGTGRVRKYQIRFGLAAIVFSYLCGLGILTIAILTGL